MVIAEYLQGIKLGLIFINFKVYAKISFQFLSSNKKNYAYLCTWTISL